MPAPRSLDDPLTERLARIHAAMFHGAVLMWVFIGLVSAAVGLDALLA